MDEKVRFQVAEEAPLPVRVTAAPGFNRKFDSRGPHKCTPDEWKILAGQTARVAQTEERPDGQKVIIGHKPIVIFEPLLENSGGEGFAAAAEGPGPASKLRMFRGKKDSGEDEKG